MKKVPMTTADEIRAAADRLLNTLSKNVHDVPLKQCSDCWVEGVINEFLPKLFFDATDFATAIALLELAAEMDGL